MTNLQSLPDEAMMDLAAFDWWVLNGDRTLTASGGNPNVLWDNRDGRMVIIDHNLAFDFSVTLGSLLQTHIFAKQLGMICGDNSLRAKYEGKFTQCVTQLPMVWAELPERWLYRDNRQTEPVDLSLATVEAVLQHHLGQSIWNR